MQYNLTLFDMAAQVASYKPNTNKSQVYRDLNGRIRALLNYRTGWSALLKQTVLNIPNAYSTGGVTMNSGSTTVNGVLTSWPVSDIVNTTMLGGNRATGYQEITPASMTNIHVDTLLYVPDGVYSEVAPVVETSQSTFTAQFQFSHNDATPLTTSSLAGQQFQLGPFNPTYTLLGVASIDGSGNNVGIIDTPFGGQTLTNTGYSLIQCYFNVDPNLRAFVQCWDPVQGIPIATNVSQAQLNAIDAQRQAQGNPLALADWKPSVSGTFQYEIWPRQTGVYSLPILYNAQWPTLKKPTDRPPYFIDPTILIDGAISDALRRKDIRSSDDKDPYFNPALAQEFDKKFALGAALAANADEEKYQSALTSSMWSQANIQPGASYWQSHISDGDGYW